MKPCVDHGQRGNRKGYGRHRFEGRSVPAHRVAYCRANGISLEQIAGLLIRHKCDNTRCVEPTHLEPGTAQDNTDDMVKRGRHNCGRGIRHGHAKLTPEVIARCKELYIPGDNEFGCRALAAWYGVSHGAMSKAIRSITWKE